MKKQRGFIGMISLLMVLSYATYGYILYLQNQSQENIKNTAHSFYNRLLYLQQQIHAYNYDQYQSGVPVASMNIFPYEIQDLEGAYVPTCTVADNEKGWCYLIDQTPWGAVSYTRDTFYTVSGTTAYRSTLLFTLPDNTTPAFTKEHSVTLAMLAQMPNILYDEATNTIEMRVERPDMAFGYDGLVKRSGEESTLLGDWDVGGDYAIVNAKDITIRNSDGSQRLVSDGLVTALLSVHDEIIEKPTCPTDKTPSITLAVGEIKIPAGFTNTGRVRPYIKSSTATQWTLGLDVIVKGENGQAYTKHDGTIVALLQCGS